MTTKELAAQLYIRFIGDMIQASAKNNEAPTNHEVKTALKNAAVSAIAAAQIFNEQIQTSSIENLSYND